MEMLRRTLLVGCALAGLWLLRVAPLDTVITVTPVDFAGMQREEAASVPEEQKTEQQRRRALLPLSVYVEEFLQYNVYSASGPTWDRFLRRADDAAAEGGGRRQLFVRADDRPVDEVAERLAAGGGTTYVSISKTDSSAYYRVVAHRWSRDDFRLGEGFVGTPIPPAGLLYPFRFLGVASVLAGLMFFVLLPPGTDQSQGPTRVQMVALASGLVAFAAPLVAVGGSVQALTQGMLLTLSCWVLAAICIHVFAAPSRTVPHPPARSGAGVGTLVQAARSTQFLREGLVFLLMAVGPVAFLIWGTMILWDR